MHTLSVRLLAAFLVSVCLCRATLAGSPPNLLIITADDLNGDSWFDSKVSATPNLDAFARTCVRFEHCHLSAPICQPSREALMTGRVPHRNGGLGFNPIRLDVPTLTEVTSSNGYFTAAINKLSHMAPREKFKWDLPLSGSGKNPALLREQFEQCLKAAAETGKPFFINANMTDPHRPFPSSQAQTNRQGKVRKRQTGGPQDGSSEVKMFAESEIVVPGFLEDLPEVRKELAQYFSGVRRMDQSFAGILEALKASGQETNTVIVFLADNGISAPFAKATVYRNGTRSPLLVRWPGLPRPFVNQTDLISSVDIMPTLLELMRLPHPAGMDGRSFVPLLRGEKQDHRDHVFTHVNTVSSGKAFPQRCVRTKSHAYIWNAWSDGQTQFRVEAMAGLTFNAMQAAAKRDAKIKPRVAQYLIRTAEEFYDTERDPDERHNLMGDPKHAERIATMKGLLLAEMKRSDDPLLQQFAKVNQAALDCVEPLEASGSSRAVIVRDMALVHTAQLLPLDREGKVVGQGDATQQTEQVLANLEKVLNAAKSNLRHVAKLNVYLAREQDAQAIRSVISSRFQSANTNTGTAKPFLPAVSFVVGTLPASDALVAIDAVAGSPQPGDLREIQAVSAAELYREAGSDHAAILPAGAKVYVSGMADTNALVVATQKTLDKLMQALAHLGLEKKNVVQLKSFLQPMSDVPAVRDEIVKYFGGRAPPMVFVEWISKSPPIEIELIATAKGDFADEPEPITFITPPGATASKVFSRIARVNYGRSIYFSGLYGLQSTKGAGQIREIFTGMGEVLNSHGSNFKQLAKATYYVSDDEASNKLNEIRPEFYDPQKPPAASKAKVKAVGLPGKTVTLDMIAVTR